MYRKYTSHFIRFSSIINNIAINLHVIHKDQGSQARKLQLSLHREVLKVTVMQTTIHNHSNLTLMSAQNF